MAIFGYMEAKAFSDEKISALRDALEPIVPYNRLIVTCGSFARREASPSSDIDFFTIHDDENEDAIDNWPNDTHSVIKKIIPKMPSAGGAFATSIKKSEILRNFGGSKDSNETITRRMLYLLEGEWITASKDFYEIRKKIIERYVSETTHDHQIAFYLLNDIIRYWRTMAVDYSDKTSGTDNPKPWAIRNIKLIFSRKLIYASGLFSVALTADRSSNEKITLLQNLFNLSAVDRIKYICGDQASKRLFEIYDYFLDTIADENVRFVLESLPREGRLENEQFRKIKNEGHYFSRELMGLFDKTFHKSHPIHMAVLF